MADRPHNRNVDLYMYPTPPHSHESIVMGSQGWDNTILGPSCTVVHILVHIFIRRYAYRLTRLTTLATSTSRIVILDMGERGEQILDETSF